MLFGVRVIIAVAVVQSLLAFGMPSASAKTRTCVFLSPVVQHCIVGVDTTLIDNKVAFQQTQVWCWAASISMIYNVYNHPVKQDEIVSRIFGAAIPTTASDQVINQAMSGSYTDDSGGSFSASFTDFNTHIGLFNIVSALEDDNPLLITTSHHAMVLSAIEWNQSVGPMGPVGQTTAAIVRDPWPSPLTYRGWQMGPGRRVMSLSEFLDIRRIVEISV